MKKIFPLFLICLLVLVGCSTGVKTTSSAIENEAFLEFIGDPGTYSGGVDVLIDDQIRFKAEVGNNKVSRVKGKLYAISTGKHLISVSYNNELIIRKQIFISAQETQKIILP